MSADINYRQRRYLISMGIRTVCLLVAVLAPLPVWLRAVAFAGAIVLPYVAVVFANGGREPEHAAEFGPHQAPRRDPQAEGGGRREIEP